MPYSTYLSNKINDHVLLGGTPFTSYVQPVNVSLGLHNGDPGPSNENNTEVLGGSYERKTIAFTPSDNGTSANSSIVTFPSMPTTTVTHISLWDENDNMLWYDSVVPQQVYSGDTMRFNVGSLTVIGKRVDS